MINMRTYWREAYRMFRCIRKGGLTLTPSRCAVNLTAAEGTTNTQARIINRALRIAK